MNKSEISQAMQACIANSTPFLTLEYRGKTAEEIKYIDKKTGRAALFHKLQLNCESLGEGGQQVKVSRELTEAEKARPDDIEVPYGKGDRIFIVVQSYSNKFGEIEIRAASVELVEE